MRSVLNQNYLINVDLNSSSEWSDKSLAFTHVFEVTQLRTDEALHPPCWGSLLGISTWSLWKFYLYIFFTFFFGILEILEYNFT